MKNKLMMVMVAGVLSLVSVTTVNAQTQTKNIKDTKKVNVTINMDQIEDEVQRMILEDISAFKKSPKKDNLVKNNHTNKTNTIVDSYASND